MVIALITGTSSGIGLATAVSLARRGHKVIATMRNLQGATELQKIISTEKLPITLADLDVNDDTSVERSIGRALAENGRIDVLVNNAGFGLAETGDALSSGVFREVMETNYFGPLRCIKAVLPPIGELRHFCILNVPSISGRIALPPQA